MSQRRSKLTGVASMDGAKGTREENRSPSRLVLALIVALASTAYAQSNDAAGARARRQVIVSVPDRKLAVLENGVVLRTFAVAVGAAVSPSPTGEFAIVNRLTEPIYYHTGVVIPAGPGNPLGPRWVGLSKPGYGIHGTNAPGSIGKAASHGCIRLRNRDIVQFFTMVNIGDTVEIHGERDEQIAEIFGGDVDAPATTVAQAHAGSGGPAGGQ